MSSSVCEAQDKLTLSLRLTLFKNTCPFVAPSRLVTRSVSYFRRGRVTTQVGRLTFSGTGSLRRFNGVRSWFHIGNDIYQAGQFYANQVSRNGWLVTYYESYYYDGYECYLGYH